jgi:dynein heavy chain, axonemal
VDEGLRQKLLTYNAELGKVKVNLDFRLMVLIREADCMAKMKIEVPIIALTLLTKREYFTTINDCLEVMYTKT